MLVLHYLSRVPYRGGSLVSDEHKSKFFSICVRLKAVMFPMLASLSMVHSGVICSHWNHSRVKNKAHKPTNFSKHKTHHSSTTWNTSHAIVWMILSGLVRRNHWKYRWDRKYLILINSHNSGRVDVEPIFITNVSLKLTINTPRQRQQE